MCGVVQTRVGRINPRSGEASGSMVANAREEVCFDARRLDKEALVPNARIGGATPLWEWIGDEPATVFSY